MTNEELLKEIGSLPISVRRRIENIIASVRERNHANDSEQSAVKRPLHEEPFCGMWADREDMKDPVAWVRHIRETQWNKHR